MKQLFLAIFLLFSAILLFFNNRVLAFGIISSHPSKSSIIHHRRRRHHHHHHHHDHSSCQNDALGSSVVESTTSFPSSYDPQQHQHQQPQHQQQHSRRNLLARIGITAGIIASSILTITQPNNNQQNQAVAAPPIAVIAEELGYFPVQNKAGELVYVPKRIRRESSEQAIALAQKLSQAGAVMYGAYWCPHCARQKELLGREAWKYIEYVECAPKGFGAKPLMCNKQDIDGYPTWIFRDKTVLGGERELADLANKVNLTSFRPELEKNVPPPLGSSSCK